MGREARKDSYTFMAVHAYRSEVDEDKQRSTMDQYKESGIMTAFFNTKNRIVTDESTNQDRIETIYDESLCLWG